MLHNRRSFVSVLASLAGVAAVDAQAAQTPPRVVAAGQWDLTWFDAFKGQHKQMYDYLDTYRDVFGLQSPDINTAVGMSRAIALNLSDGVWQKYKIGERYKIADPMTKQPAVRNIFLSDGDLSVKAMQARGTVFWQCNVALGQVAQQLAQASGTPVADVRADLIAGLNPGVRLVPSHVMAIGIAQEHGFTYMKA
jgi:hypothetical protein